MEWIRYVVCVRLRHETNMSNDARLMRDGVLAVLDKLYARDDLPQEVRTARKAVYAHGYVGNAARLYIAGDFAGAQSDIVKAVELNPQLLAGEPMKVVQQLFAWAQHPLVQDSHRFLNAVRTHFPASIVVSRRHWRKAYAMHYMSKVFESPTDSGNVRKALPRAILRDPSWLANVGVWSIATEAFLGKTVSGFLRQALGELRS